MSVQPVVPLGGYAGWRFLARTADAQRELFAADPAIRRETAAFRTRIDKATSAEALVADRTLLKVALGAYGLDQDLGSRAFLRRVLESDGGDPASFANRLADGTYREFASAFGYGSRIGANVDRPGFGARVAAAYETRQFEIAVGKRDPDLRLALSADRELAELSERRGSADALWLTVMGRPPLRKVFETALGLPASFGALDLDRQMDVFREKTRRALGGSEVAQFADPGRREDLIRLFLLRSEASGAAARAPGSTALALLRSAPRVSLA